MVYDLSNIHFLNTTKPNNTNPIPPETNYFMIALIAVSILSVACLVALLIYVVFKCICREYEREEDGGVLSNVKNGVVQGNVENGDEQSSVAKGSGKSNVSAELDHLKVLSESDCQILATIAECTKANTNERKNSVTTRLQAKNQCKVTSV